MGPSVAGPIAEPPSATADSLGGVDPLDGPMAAGPQAEADGQADDLLSQLAGAEIDRMLAEADVEPPPPPPPVPLPTSAVTRPVIVAAEPAVDDLPPEVTVEPEPVIPPEVVAAAPPVEPPVAPPAPVVVGTSDLDAVLADAAAERSALRTPPAPALGAVSPRAGPADTVDLGAPLARLPLAMRPLTLLSAPLEEYPDRVRDAIGKVAVVTLLNSAAVIAYVMIFRRPG